MPRTERGFAKKFNVRIIGGYGNAELGIARADSPPVCFPLQSGHPPSLSRTAANRRKQSTKPPVSYEHTGQMNASAKSDEGLRVSAGVLAKFVGKAIDSPKSG